MKRMTRLLLCALCAAALLSGCGNQTTEPSTSASAVVAESDAFEGIKMMNYMDTLLTRHSSVYFVDSLYKDESRAVPTVITTGQYTKDGEHVQYHQDKYSDQDGILYDTEGHADDTYAGALYECGTKAEDGKTMTLYYDEETYQIQIFDRWSGVTSLDGTVLSASESSDGELVVEVKSAASPDYVITRYVADKETYEIKSYTMTEYDQNDKVVSVLQRTVTYDQPQTFELSPFQTILGGQDYCELNVICDPEGEDMRVNWYPVAHDTTVFFSDLDRYTLYSDDALTQTMDPLSSIDVTGEVQNVFVVPNP